MDWNIVGLGALGALFVVAGLIVTTRIEEWWDWRKHRKEEQANKLKDLEERLNRLSR